MSKTWWVIIIVVILIGLGVTGYLLYLNSFASNPLQGDKIEKTSPNNQWKEGGVAVAGKYADADLVDLEGGKWRLYYSVEPEVAGNKLELYSATSTDGKSWKQEPGVRSTFKTFA